MPLRVHCPSGCLVRMPSNRAEKVVRCPSCKLTIRIPAVPDSEKSSGKPIPIHATLIEPQPSSAPLDAGQIVEDIDPTAIAKVGVETSPPTEPAGYSMTNDDSEPTKTSAPPAESDKDLAQAKELDAAKSPFESDHEHSEVTNATAPSPATSKPAPTPSASASTPSPTPPQAPAPTPQAGQASQPRLTIPAALSPVGIKKNKEQRKAELQQILSSPEPIVEFKHIEVDRTRRKKKRRRSRPEPPPVANVEDPTSIQDSQDNDIPWEERLQESNADRVVLARFFGFALCVVAFINMVPAFYYWNDWYQAVEVTPLPRWIYLQVFVAAIHIIYAVFLFQISRWSAMRAVSVAMLVVAFVFGVISAGLLIGGGQGVVAAFLGLSFVMVKRAAIWCVVMLVLATLMSYLGGRESANWQRAELLLEEILSGGSADSVGSVSNNVQENTSAQTS